MTVAASELMREYAADRWPTLNHKGRMSRLAGVLNWTPRRARSIYQNDQNARLRADEFAAVQNLKTQEAKNEFSELRARIARLETALAVVDEDFHSPQIDGLGAALHGGGGMVRAGTSGGKR